jgi:hypothetical protein
MRALVLAVLLFASPAFADDARDAAEPNTTADAETVLRQQAKGCALGAGVGAAVSLLSVGADGGSSIVIGCLAGAAGAPAAVHVYENHREQIADFIDNDVRYATNRFISLVSHLLR